jgi:hypothetical protein
VVLLNDILEAKQEGKKFRWRWMERFETYYDKNFGPGWTNKDKEVWAKFNFPT